MTGIADRENRIIEVIKKYAIAVLCLLLTAQVVLLVAVPAFASPQETTVFVAGTTVNVYSGAGSSTTALGKASSGREYEWLGETTDSSGRLWYRIQYTSSKTGWLSSASAYKLTPEIKADPQLMLDVVARAYGTVGIQVATVENGIVSAAYNHGWAIKNTRPMTTDIKIRVASLSKVAIAMTAMKMQEEGLLSLGANVGEYWGVTPYRAVTLRHLLSHTSTLKDLTPGSSASALRSQLTSSGSYSSGVLGSTWVYNNYGAALAGSTLEMAAGESIDSYADRKLFNWLGIDAAWMSGRVDTSKLATLYYANDSVGRSAETSAGLVGSTTLAANTAYYAGGFTTSAAEYARLIAVLANDGTYNGVRYLEEASVAEMESVILSDPGRNGRFSQSLALRSWSGLYGQSHLYYHTGNAYGMLALASYNPDTRNGVVVLTTGSTQYADANGIYSVCGLLTKYFYEHMEEQTIRMPAQDVEIVPGSVELKLGESLALSAVIEPADCTSEVTWISSSPECVTVNRNGIITAVGYGSAMITALVDDVADICMVTVAPQSGDSDYITLKPGEIYLFDASSMTGGNITYTTASGNVLVTADGRILAVNAETTDVVTVSDGTGTRQITVEIGGDKNRKYVVNFVCDLYTVVLDRDAEAEGAIYWCDLLNGDVTNGANVAYGFFFSDEYIAQNKANIEYINDLYRVFMRRNADWDGYDYWTSIMAQGATRENVFTGFINAQEWVDVCYEYNISPGGNAPSVSERAAGVYAFAERLYTTCLGRDADPSGLEYWAQELLARRTTGTNAAYGFFFGSEFVNANYSNGEFVIRLYRTLMGRAPGTEELNYWCSEIQAGATRENIFTGFANSAEFAAICDSCYIIR